LPRTLQFGACVRGRLKVAEESGVRGGLFGAGVLRASRGGTRRWSAAISTCGRKKHSNKDGWRSMRRAKQPCRRLRWTIDRFTRRGGRLLQVVSTQRPRAGPGRHLCAISVDSRIRMRDVVRHAQIVDGAEFERLRREICRSYNNSPRKKKYWLALLEMYGRERRCPGTGRDASARSNRRAGCQFWRRHFALTAARPRVSVASLRGALKGRPPFQSFEACKIAIRGDPLAAGLDSESSQPGVRDQVPGGF
jgi:hypothetical protein